MKSCGKIKAMISKKFRFHGHGALKFVFAKGEQKRGDFFAIKFTKNPRRKNSRIAVIISKKVFKHAVDRNRARRRVYEIARKSVKSFAKNDKNFDIAISLYRPEINEVSHADLVAKLVPPLREILTGEKIAKNGNFAKNSVSNSPRKFAKK